jgi:hypothetical protein
MTNPLPRFSIVWLIALYAACLGHVILIPPMWYGGVIGFGPRLQWFLASAIIFGFVMAALTGLVSTIVLLVLGSWKARLLAVPGIGWICLAVIPLVYHQMSFMVEKWLK